MQKIILIIALLILPIISYAEYGTDFLDDASTCTADIEYVGGPCEQAYDNNTATAWQTETTGFPHWIKLDLGSGITKRLDKFSLILTVNAVNWKTFYIEGSNDDSNWTNISGNLVHQNNTNWQDFLLTSSTQAYRYFRITGTDNWTPSIWAEISEIEGFEELTSTSTMSSTTITMVDSTLIFIQYFFDIILVLGTAIFTNKLIS